MKAFDLLKTLDSQQESLVIDTSVFRMLQDDQDEESIKLEVPNDVLRVQAVPGQTSFND